MSLFSLFVLAVGLSMDAFAVAVSNGIIIRGLTLRHALKTALFFGFFQAFMPVLGYAAGSNWSAQIQSIDHWIAFVVLAGIGAKMIRDACKAPDCTEEAAAAAADPTNNRTLTALAVATSIDALAVGVSFSFLHVAIVRAALLIGSVTFALSLAGVLFGKRCGQLFQKQATLSGGTILIGIGLKILLEHTGVLAAILA